MPPFSSNWQLIITFLVFILVYLLIAIKFHFKLIFLYSALLILLFLNILKIPASFGYINFNILGLFLGTLVVAEVFFASRVPAVLAEIVIRRTQKMVYLIIGLAAISGILSIFLDNVSTILILSPLALEIAKKFQTSPKHFIIPMCLAANLQGAATLVGDPPSMILAATLKMNFLDFFFMQGKPGIFFAVELGFIAGLLILFWKFRKQQEKIRVDEPTKVISYVPLFILLLYIITLAIISLLSKNGNYLGKAALTALAFGVISFIFSSFNKQLRLFSPLKKIDWETFFFLAGVFILVGIIKQVGGIKLLTDWLSSFLQGNLLFAFIFLIVFSIIISAFIDNIPYFIILVDVLRVVAEKNGFPLPLLLFGSLIAITVGGNITPFGASANLVGTGYLKKRGYSVSFKDFINLGLPFSIAGVIVGSIFLWLFWR